jgi:hypothetical protein
MVWFFLRKLLNQASQGSRRPRLNGNQRQYRPWFELLEDRLTPSTVNWTGDSGSWSVAANWTDDMGVHRLPTAADDAVIGVAGVTITHATGTDTVQSLTISDNASATLELSGGSLALSTRSTVGSTDAFNFSGGTLGGLGTLEVTDGATMTWTSGLMSATGTTAIDMGGCLQISGGNKTMAGRSLENAGTLSWSGATVLAERGARISNLNGGVIDFVDDSGVSFGGFDPFPSFINAGTVRKSVGTGTSTIGIAFDNSGTVEVHSGTLSIGPSVAQVSGNTLTDGTWYVGANSALALVASITTNQANVTLDGADSVFAALNNLASNEGSFSLLGGRDFTSAGDWNNSGSLTVAANSTLTVNGTFTQAANGSLTVQLGGTAAGQFSRVVVIGQATLDGILDVTEVGGFTPAAGDTFQVMSFGSSSGDFATKNGFQFGNGLFFREDLNGTDLTLEAFQAQLVFQQEPTDTTAGQTITPAVQVAIVDPATGTPIGFDNSDTVTVSLNGGGTLSGTLSVTVANGVAMFGDLSIDLAGSGYTLHVTVTGLTDADSAAFNITA